MKGFVPTPAHVVDLMVEKLFRPCAPTSSAELLDPGCGTGEFVDGVLRWCAKNAAPLPSITGVDSNPGHVAVSRSRFAHFPNVRITLDDFLGPTNKRYDYIVGNPPYVPITALDVAERNSYRRGYATAKGRFDLYLLFFEQALRLLRPGARLVFITPEKFLYVGSAAPLRQLLRDSQVEELHFASEDTFGDLITYPLISTVVHARPVAQTRVIHRTGRTASVSLAPDSTSWLPLIRGRNKRSTSATLADVCVRISCGVATGADSVFVLRDSDLPARLKGFAHRTLAGRQLQPDQPLKPTHSILVPYQGEGTLLPESKLGALGEYLAEPARRRKLLARTCVSRKPWYAFHETPPLRHLGVPKLLCKDIGAAPFFAIDREGSILPRHSLYYIVPAHSDDLDDLASFLNSSFAQRWLRDHCQRAAGGFLRLQSHVLKRLPVPARFAGPQAEFFASTAS